jgi:hypothetical protein
LTAETTRYVLTYIEKNPAFYYFYKYTYVPDEMFFQTLILNSTEDSIKSNIINRNFRYFIFKQGAGEPTVFTIENLQALLDSDRFIARKFDITIDKDILDKLDEMSQKEKHK